MIGKMLEKIRKEKKITKSELSKKLNIHLGHLIHIEKEERNPSFKTFKNICSYLNVPYTLLLGLYDTQQDDESLKYNIYDHLNYNKILLINDYQLIDCPNNSANSSFAMYMYDDSMQPTIENNQLILIELGAPLNHKDIGLVLFNNKTILRRFIVRKNHILLKPDNRSYQDIVISKDDEFKIIGKITDTK